MGNLGNFHHGHARAGSESPTHQSWRAMINRCEYPSNIGYKHYGARGITICTRWHTFELFLADMGERPPGHTLDRYPNRHGNYEPGNTRWATPTQQLSNRDVTRLETYRGVTKPLIEWAYELGLNYGLLFYRIQDGWTTEKAFEYATGQYRHGSRWLTYQGRTLTVTQWSREIGIDRGTIYARLRKGWSDEAVLTTPLDKSRSYKVRGCR